MLTRNIKYRVFCFKDRLFRSDTTCFFEANRSLEAAKNVNEPSVLGIAGDGSSPLNSSAREFG
jgi:hypothetical protein